MSNESGLAPSSPGLGSQTAASAVGQTANIGRSTSMGSGAAKVFREFKWGLLTLFLLMVVVIGLVYDGGRKKKPSAADNTPKGDDRNPAALLESGPETGAPPVPVTPSGGGASVAGGSTTPGTNTPAPRGGPPIIEGPAPAPGGQSQPRPADPRPGSEGQLAGGPVPPGPEKGAPVPPASEKTYSVKSGDTLTSIANTLLPGKNNLKAILDANKDVLPNPNRLRVGMTLKIPAALPSTAQEATARKYGSPDPKTSGNAGGPALGPPPAPKADGVEEYIVQNGDTLERIARKIFNDGRKWRELYEWNRDQIPDPGRLRVGQVLKIKQAGARNTAGTLPAAGAPRADGDEKAAPAGASSSASAKAEGSGEVQVMSANSSASLP